jgi:hypothetical protein
MEDAPHCGLCGLVVGVDRFWVVRRAGWDRLAAARGAQVIAPRPVRSCS